jgi:precorrin-3B C17-methyltransferase
MTGHLAIVGLGPGGPEHRTPAAEAVLAACDDLIGYGPYVARVAARPGQVAHPTDNREELGRARHALALAAAGRRVAVVSSGDAGVFAMAAAVFEAAEHGEAAWRALEVEVVPGISAMLAAASRVGAPLGHDFCAISLSDNLKPWPLVLRRLRAAAEAGFAMALYNPVSRARPWQLAAALDLLREVLPGSVPVMFVTAATRAEERVALARLDAAEAGQADMRTLVIVGSAETRVVERTGGGAWVYSPRSAA